MDCCRLLGRWLIAYSLYAKTLSLDARRSPEDGFYQPDIGVYVVRDLGNSKFRHAWGQGCEDDQLVGEMPIDGGSTVEIVQKGMSHNSTNGLGSAVERAGPIGS